VTNPENPLRAKAFYKVWPVQFSATGLLKTPPLRLTASLPTDKNPFINPAVAGNIKTTHP
jgi:hypothetical protein